MSALDPLPKGRARQFAAVLDDLANIDSPEVRWLRERRDAIHRAHAEMLAERDADTIQEKAA